ncbi:MAG: SdpI family protein [Pseudanabaenaceae cyanobacterium]
MPEPKAAMDDFLLINLLFIVAGVIFMLLAIPLILQKVPPNQWYGFRTTKTLSDETIWYAVNKLMGYDLLAVGAAIVASGVSLLLAGRALTLVQTLWINLGVLGTALLLGLIHGLLALRDY